MNAWRADPAADRHGCAFSSHLLRKTRPEPGGQIPEGGKRGPVSPDADLLSRQVGVSAPPQEVNAHQGNCPGRGGASHQAPLGKGWASGAALTGCRTSPGSADRPAMSTADMDCLRVRMPGKTSGQQTQPPILAGLPTRMAEAQAHQELQRRVTGPSHAQTHGPLRKSAHGLCQTSCSER